jgi:hypothetical protein
MFAIFATQSNDFALGYPICKSYIWYILSFIYFIIQFYLNFPWNRYNMYWILKILKDRNNISHIRLSCCLLGFWDYLYDIFVMWISY